MKSETFEQMLQDKLLKKRLFKIDEDYSMDGAISGVRIICDKITGVEIEVDGYKKRIVPFDQNCMIVTALEKLVGELGVKAANHAAGKGNVHGQARTPGQINHYPGQSFVQWHIGVAVAADAFFVAHGLVHRLAQGDAHVFHRVVAVDVQIAFRLNLQVDQAVASDLVQHVVKKADARGQA